MQIASGATPLPPRLLMFNDTQWIGDYVASGTTQIVMDLLNSGTAALPIRIAIREGTGCIDHAGLFQHNAVQFTRRWRMAPRHVFTERRESDRH